MLRAFRLSSRRVDGHLVPGRASERASGPARGRTRGLVAAASALLLAAGAGISLGAPSQPAPEPGAPGAPGAGEPARARPQGRVARVAHVPPEMVIVPAGKFRMGADPVELEVLLRACQVQFGAASAACEEDHNRKLLEREVYLDAFAIDRHEVTAARYRECVAAGRCSVSALVAGDERFVRDDWPMVNVNWQDAVDYCAFAGKRLPSEAEWEKAARGTSATRWPWGDHEREDGANHGRCESDAVMLSRRNIGGGPIGGPPPLMFAPDDSDGHATLARPGSLRWGESPYGAQDMAGNAGEWVQDYLGPEGYEDLPAFNPVRATPHPQSFGLRVVRGGSWMEPAFFGYTYYRRWADASERSERYGFRCARSLD